ERRDPLRERRGKQDAGGSPFSCAHQSGLFDTGVIHDGPDIVHGIVQGCRGGHAVREPGAASIQHGQAREGGQSIHEPSQRGPLSGDLEMEKVTRCHDQIRRTLALRRISNEQLAAARVVDGKAHAVSLDPPLDTRKYRPASAPPSLPLRASGFPRPTRPHVGRERALCRPEATAEVPIRSLIAHESSAAASGIGSALLSSEPNVTVSRIASHWLSTPSSWSIADAGESTGNGGTEAKRRACVRPPLRGHFALV